MCFSSTASFITAGLTGTIGIVSLSRVDEPRQILLAAAPIFFALQQSIEGLLWLTLPVAPDGPGSAGLTLLFLLFAQVFWPVYVPIAVLCIEPAGRRRQTMAICLAIGSAVAAQLLGSILSQSHGAVILDGHVVYVTEQRHSDALAVAYLTTTCLPPLISSARTVAALGAIVLVGSVVAYVLYWEAFASVWCFFAAAASMVILGHFEHSRQRRMRTAAI
jgi:hypothetical protein